MPDIRAAAPGRYHSALELAEIILQSAQLVPRGSGLRGSSILFHTPTMWERSVGRWVRSQWPGQLVKTKFRFPLSPDHQESAQLTAEADIVVFSRDDRTLLGLYDAKYKAFGAAPKREDLYQMVAYCERLGLTPRNTRLSGRVPADILHDRSQGGPSHWAAATVRNLTGIRGRTRVHTAVFLFSSN